MPENTTHRCDKCNFCYRAKSKKYKDACANYCAFNNRDVSQSHFGKNSPKKCPLRDLSTIIYCQDIVTNVIINQSDNFKLETLIDTIKPMLFENEHYVFFDNAIDLRIFVATELERLIQEKHVIETNVRQYSLIKQATTKKALDKLNIVTIHRKRQLESQTISKGFFGTTSIKHWSPEKSPECYVTNLSHQEFSKQLKTQPFVSLYDPIREEYVSINTTEIADIRFKKCTKESEK